MKKYWYHIPYTGKFKEAVQNGEETQTTQLSGVFGCTISSEHPLLTKEGVEEIKDLICEIHPNIIKGTIVILNIIPLEEEKE